MSDLSTALKNSRPLQPVQDVETQAVDSRRERYHVDWTKKQVVRTIRTLAGPVKTRVPLLVAAPKDDPHSTYDWCWLRQTRRQVPSNDPTPMRIVDMFAGCAQMSIGVSEACSAIGRRGDLVLAVDAYPAAAEMCRRLYPHVTALRARVEDLFGAQLGKPCSSTERELRRQAGTVDFLVGGPPCQGHSNLNNRSRRKDARNPLGFRIVRAAEVLEPTHVVIENVLGIRHDHGHVFSRMMRGLEKLGYRVAEGIVYAEHVGVAQRRHRTFLVATRARGVDPKAALMIEKGTPRTFEWACGDLIDRSDELMSQHPVPKPQNQARIDYLFENELYDLPPAQRPACHRNGTAYTSSYGRIAWEQPVQTITTTFQCIGTGRFIHPRRRRPLTLLEAARLQSIPDFVDFSKLTRTTIAQLIGNAVPPKVLYSIALRLLWDAA